MVLLATQLVVLDILLGAQEHQEALGSQDQLEAWECQEEVLEFQEHQEVLEVSNIQEQQVLDVVMNILGQIWMTI